MAKIIHIADFWSNLKVYLLYILKDKIHINETEITFLMLASFSYSAVQYGIFKVG